MADLSYTTAENHQRRDNDGGIYESTEEDISRNVDPGQTP